MRRSVQQSAQRGFSLIELAVVLLILAVLLSLGIGALSTMYKGRQYRSTQESMDNVRRALGDYLRSNGRLPCPDTDVNAPDGRENAPCAAQRFGLVPHLDLGLQQDAALDGWDNFLSYMISTTFGGPGNANRNWTTANQFFVGNTGELTDAGPGALTNYVVAVISHGPNGNGAYTRKGTRNLLPAAATNPDELDNTDNDQTFVIRQTTDDSAAAGGAFDDLVSALQPNDLISPLVRDGALTSPEGTVAHQFNTLKNQIIGLTLFNYDAPNNRYEIPTNAQVNALPRPTDPWGIVWDFARNTQWIDTASGPGNAFTLTSFGPDRQAGGGDDRVFVVTVSEIQGILARTGF